MNDNECDRGRGRRLRRRLLEGQGRASPRGSRSGSGSKRDSRGVGSGRPTLLGAVGLVVEDLRNPDGLLRPGMRWLGERLAQARLRAARLPSGAVVDIDPAASRRDLDAGKERRPLALPPADTRPSASAETGVAQAETSVARAETSVAQAETSVAQAETGDELPEVKEG